MTKFIDADKLAEALNNMTEAKKGQISTTAESDTYSRTIREGHVNGLEAAIVKADRLTVEYREACACGCEKRFHDDDTGYHGRGKNMGGCGVCWDGDKCSYYRPVLWPVKS